MQVRQKVSRNGIPIPLSGPHKIVIGGKKDMAGNENIC